MVLAKRPPNVMSLAFWFLPSTPWFETQFYLLANNDNETTEAKQMNSRFFRSEICTMYSRPLLGNALSDSTHTMRKYRPYNGECSD